MQTGKRVYPRQREPGKWLSYLLLFLSAVVVISGVVSRGGDLTIEPAATATPRRCALSARRSSCAGRWRS